VITSGLSHPFPVWRVSEILQWVESGEYKGSDDRSGKRGSLIDTRNLWIQKQCSKTKTESSLESRISAPSPGPLPRPARAGANLAFTYQGERLKENVESLTNEAMPDSLLLSCDVTKQEEVDETFRHSARSLAGSIS
jgi:hypothetical protein